MAAIVGYNTTHVESGELGNKRTKSCSGVPGSDGPPSAYIYVNLWIALAVDEDGHLYFRPSNGRVRQTGMTDVYRNTWWSYFVPQNRKRNIVIEADPDNPQRLTTQFEKAYPLYEKGDNESGGKRATSFFKTLWMEGQYGIESLTGNSSFSAASRPNTSQDALNKGFARLQFDIDDLETAEIEEEGGVRTEKFVLWLFIPICYEGVHTTDITLVPEPVYISRTELLAYKPGEIRSGSNWLSHNRDAGEARIVRSGSYGDILNYYAEDTTTSDGLIRSSSSWSIMRKIGDE